MKSPRQDESIAGPLPVNDLKVVMPPVVLSPLDWLAAALLIAAGLNWAVFGLAGVDVVTLLLGTGVAARGVHVLFGLAALVGLARVISLARGR